MDEQIIDFLTPAVDLICWSFDWQKLQEAYAVENYAVPVLTALFCGFQEIIDSKYRRVQNSDFVVYAGDFGSDAAHFGIGVPYKTNQRVKDIFYEQFQLIDGFERIEFGNTGYDLPFIPLYRCQAAQVIEYTEETEQSGKRGPGGFGSEIEVVFREYDFDDGWED